VSAAERQLTMLFTDVEGSTRLAQELGEAWALVLADHRRLIRAEVEAAGGRVETTEGDSFFATFASPAAAARVATGVQRGLREHPWPDDLDGELRVRMGIHAGAARHTDGHWVGIEVHRAARIADAAHGGQVIVSEPVRAKLGASDRCEELGRHRLKDFPAAEPLFHLRVDERHARDFPPPRTLGAVHSILGRWAELDRICALADRAAAGGPGALLVVEGEAGIGKTRLLDELRESAPGYGMALCSARGAELERDFAFGLVRQLLEPPLAAADESERAKLLSGAAGLAAAVLGTGSGGVEPGAAMHGLHWLVAALADRRPLVLVVDDAHWGDEASLRFLAYLARRVESLPVLVAVGSRPPSADGEAAPAVELLADPEAERLRLAALDTTSVARLLSEQLGRPADPDFAAACLEATGGNPFLLGELARELRRLGIEPRAAEAGRVVAQRPDRVARSLALRLRRLGPAAEALAPAIALLGDGAELGLAGELAGLDGGAAAATFDGLVGEGLLVPALPPRYVHPLLRTAAEALLAPAERSRLHGRAAELLTEGGAPAERVASHLLEAEPRGDPGRVDLLAAAARQAGHRGAPEVAARLLRRAIEEPPLPERLRPLRYALGQAESELGLVSAAEHLRAAAAAEDPDLAARATRALAWAIGPDPEAHRATAPMLGRAIEGVASRDRELAAELEALRFGSFWLVPEFADRLERELPRFRDLPGESRAESLALSLVARVLMQRGEPASVVEGVVLAAAAQADAALGDDDMAGLWTINLAIVASAVDRLDVGTRLTERALAIARERGSANRFALASNLRAMIRLDAGDLRGAEADACAALASEGLKGPMAYQSLIPLVGSLADQGRAEEGRRLLVERRLDGAIPPARPLTALLVERARLLLAAGDAEAAVADLAEADRRLAVAAAGRGAIGLDAWLERILALRSLGREEEARREAEAALAAARGWGTNRAVGGAMRVAGLLTEGRQGLALLAEAAELLAASRARLWHARTLVDLGAALRVAGLERSARKPLEAGLVLAEDCGAAPLAATARQVLTAVGREVPPRRDRRDTLSAEERRIAEVAATGAADTEIAQQLFLTVRAVEAHRVSAYGKLRVRTRRELAGALGGTSGP
jgi:class 3 adenylate cyclase/DNA-binding CsgD family transcriptional regulator/tetratricopeptide (TPR) repeat protein